MKRLQKLFLGTRDNMLLQPTELTRRAHKRIFPTDTRNLRIKKLRGSLYKKLGVRDKRSKPPARPRGKVSNMVQRLQKTQKVGKNPNVNDTIPLDFQQQSASDRMQSISAQADQQKKRNNSDPFAGKQERSGAQKELRWMNPGTAKILECIKAIKGNTAMPSWAIHFNELLTVKNNKLLFEGKIMLTEEGKHRVVKSSYFDPRKPSTPRIIFERYDNVYANLTRKDCERVLKSIETYQLNFPRRRPPEVTGRVNISKQGILMFDCFFSLAY